jgi:hypothetical protein
MTDLNGLARELNVETHVQGEKLVRLDEHVTRAKDNVEKGNEQLESAEKN